ncbi:MAG TPA: hypothetical protein VFS60_04440 [Thermoanaerobaculia bacterium]|nr:hypothetical protein [Thermoanaerobaculia bacterium]
MATPAWTHIQNPRRSNMSCRRSIVLLLALVAAALPMSAKTPDGEPPSVETVCDNETGAAFGLCNAYCEAMDCDSPNHHASDQACASVRKNFEKKTGRPIPCEVTCPCFGLLPLFAQLQDESATAVRCEIASEFIIVTTDNGPFAAVITATEERPHHQCTVNDAGPFVDLTDAERLVCRVGLRQAAEAQGITCLPPN